MRKQTPFKMMLKILASQNIEKAKKEGWNYVPSPSKVEESEDGRKSVKLPIDNISIEFDENENFIGIVNYKE